MLGEGGKEERDEGGEGVIGRGKGSEIAQSTNSAGCPHLSPCAPTESGADILYFFTITNAKGLTSQC